MLATGIGFLAALCTTIAFLPQVIKIWRSKSAKDLSFGMVSILFSGVLLWLIYGILIRDTPIILANSVTLSLIFILLYFKFSYED